LRNLYRCCSVRRRLPCLLERRMSDFLSPSPRSMSAHFHARSARERARNRSKSRTQAVTRGSPEIAVELRKRPLTCRSAFWPGPIPKLRLQVSNPKFCRLEWLFVPAGARRRDLLAERSQAVPGPDGRAVEPLKRKTVEGVPAGRFGAAAPAESMPYAKTSTTRSYKCRSEASQAASSSATGSRACRMAAALF